MGITQDFAARLLDVLAAHPYLQVILFVLAFIVFAQIIDRICSRVIVRYLNELDSETGNRIVALFHRPVFVTVILVGVLFALNRLDLDGTTGYWPVDGVKTVLVLVWTILAYRLFKVLLRAMVANDRRFGFAHPSTAPLFGNGIAVSLFLVGSYAIMHIWDVDVTGLVASAGILGLALSFAAKDTLANLFAGISILADRPYEIGDYIVLDSGERGEVTHIGLRSTRLLTRDDVGVTIPNGVIARAKIINEAAGSRDKYRIRIKVGIAYGSDIAKVIEILEDAARQHEEICAAPAPRVRFRAFGESSLDLELLCWIIRPADRGRLVHELNLAVYVSFRNRDINIPFPQREITLKGPLK